jgi:hypothetical protein
MLPRPKVSSEQGPHADADYSSMIQSADLWLTERSVEGFDRADFANWPEGERESLAKEVEAFLAIAGQMKTDKPATRTQSDRARSHLERAIRIVRQPILHDWLEAQVRMFEEATSAAQSNGWYVEQDEKEVSESLLGTYKAPRLRIRTRDKEVVLDPIARFGSGRQGVVDLVVMPTYETAYYITLKCNQWQIVSPKGTLNSRPFTQETFVNTIAGLPQR